MTDSKVNLKARFDDAVRRACRSKTRRVREAPVLAAWYLVNHAMRAAARLSFSLRYETRARLFWGDSMVVVLPDDVCWRILVDSFYEKGLTRMVLEYLREGMTFLDVGAHIGYYTLLASWIVGDKGSVHAWEPTPRTHSILSRNAGNKGNVVLNNAALFSRSGRIRFVDLGPMYEGSNSIRIPRLDAAIAARLRPREMYVPTMSVDEYVTETGIAPSFVKIDAESVEYEILLGMEATIEEHRPIISLEVGDLGIPGAASSADLVSHLRERGYEPYESDGCRVVQHRQRSEYTPGNLLFVPRV